jgi:hypothetical protein
MNKRVTDRRMDGENSTPYGSYCNVDGDIEINKNTPTVVADKS